MFVFVNETWEGRSHLQDGENSSCIMTFPIVHVSCLLPKAKKPHLN